MSSTRTGIEWTDKTWNPMRGCRIISPGCQNCYAMKMAHRFSGADAPYNGLTELTLKGPRWNGEGKFAQSVLSDPLGWKQPCRVFVDSMSDLFYDAFTDEQIAAVFGVMSMAPQHTFQVLTKRAARMREWFEKVARKHADPAQHCVEAAWEAGAKMRAVSLFQKPNVWPLENVWMGVSVESQEYADERIPYLVNTPAALRFVSYEPALGPVDWDRWLGFGGVEWVIAGGESGPRARPCNAAWFYQLIEQARPKGVAVFVKQLGSKPYDSMLSIVGGWMPGDPEPDDTLQLLHKRGQEMAEWPARVRVRQFPQKGTEKGWTVEHLGRFLDE